MTHTTLTHKYGEFNCKQIDEYKTKMRKKIFWLILYTDEKINDQYKNVNVVSYHENLLKQLSGLNSIFNNSSDIVDIICILESALIELKKEDFNFKSYRKLVLDAGALMENLKVGE